MTTREIDYKAKLIEAEEKAGMWLHRGNVATERGEAEKAARHYEKAQKWFDEANRWRYHVDLNRRIAEKPFAEVVSVDGNEGPISDRDGVEPALTVAWEQTGAWACAVACGDRVRVVATIDAAGDIYWT